MILRIHKSGVVDAIHDDRFDWRMLGDLKIKRASHVEPDENNNWWADLSPINGPVLGPFSMRNDALNAEIAWLHEHILNCLSS